MKKFFKPLILLLVSLSLIWGILFAAFPLPGSPSVLMYHFFGSDKDAGQSKNFVSRKSFARQMAWLKYGGYHVITLDEYNAIRTGKQKSRGREILLTFDDGNYSFETDAYPVLKKYDFPGVIFLVSESVKHKSNGSMDTETVKRILSGSKVEVGSHSQTHPFLSQMSEEQIRRELVDSRKDLEGLFGVPVLDFAYPYGDYNERVMKIAEEAGYRTAFTTSYKKLRSAAPSSFALTRTKITRSANFLPVFWVELSGIYDSYKAFRHRLKDRRNAA